MIDYTAYLAAVTHMIMHMPLSDSGMKRASEVVMHGGPAPFSTDAPFSDDREAALLQKQGYSPEFALLVACVLALTPQSNKETSQRWVSYYCKYFSL